jgi:hypothetical protein
MRLAALISLTVVLSGLGIAHPGHDVGREMQEREAALISLPRDLSHCAGKMKARGITAEAAARRTRIAREARKARGLDTGKSCQSLALITTTNTNGNRRTIRTFPYRCVG